MLCTPDGYDFTHSLALAGSRIICGSVGCDFAPYDFKERHFADKRVCYCLETNSGKRSVFITLYIALTCMLRSYGSGESDFVKQHINSVTRVARAGIYGIYIALAYALIERTCNFTSCELLAGKEFLHKVFVGCRNGLCKYIKHFADSGILRHRNL